MPDEQRSVIEQYVEQQGKETAAALDFDNDTLVDQVDTAHARIVELKTLLSNDPLDESTEISELPALIARHREAMTLIGDILDDLERTVS